MKRKSFRNRVMACPTPFVRPVDGRQPDLARLSSANGQSDPRTRKIFVIEQVRRPPSTNTDKKIRRILIFDNHPDSLRLVFGRRADSHVHLSDPQRMTSSGVVLLWILVMGLMLAMLWPLF
jgi:hypothetical protein